MHVVLEITVQNVSLCSVWVLSVPGGQAFSHLIPVLQKVGCMTCGYQCMWKRVCHHSPAWLLHAMSENFGFYWGRGDPEGILGFTGVGEMIQMGSHTLKFEFFGLKYLW